MLFVFAASHRMYRSSWRIRKGRNGKRNCNAMRSLRNRCLRCAKPPDEGRSFISCPAKANKKLQSRNSDVTLTIHWEGEPSSLFSLFRKIARSVWIRWSIDCDLGSHISFIFHEQWAQSRFWAVGFNIVDEYFINISSETVRRLIYLLIRGLCVGRDCLPSLLKLNAGIFFLSHGRFLFLPERNLHMIL